MLFRPPREEGRPVIVNIVLQQHLQERHEENDLP